MKPQYEHDCSCCTFLGQYTCTDNKYGMEGKQVDLYFHRYKIGEPTVLGRFSSDGPDYSSGLVFIEHCEWLYEAAKRAIKSGLLKSDDSALGSDTVAEMLKEYELKSE